MFSKVWVEQEALYTMLGHAVEQLHKGVEVGGVVTARLLDNNVASVNHAIPTNVGYRTGIHLGSKSFWRANEAKKKREIEEHILGWYHSHPSYSCFMSKEDVKGHESMLNMDKNAIAIVVDPKRFVDGDMFENYLKVFTTVSAKNGKEPIEIPSSASI